MNDVLEPCALKEKTNKDSLKGPLACGGRCFILGMAEPVTDEATSRHIQVPGSQLRVGPLSVSLTEIFKCKYVRWFFDNDLNKMGDNED